MTSNNEMARRLQVLEKKMNSSEFGGGPGVMQVVIGYGFLPPGVPLFANAGIHEWLRGISAEGEIIEEEKAFMYRCHAEAQATGEKLLIIGCLPRDGSETQRAVAKLAEDYFWANDDGVPECEER
ncbi:hypothetical protein [Nitrobacter sp. JJSN]|uniref:hypothetical protein n=1 Tax=Nitrobacter sp. JJSN TaxID=3453033 RepID=UPI003F769684